MNREVYYEKHRQDSSGNESRSHFAPRTNMRYDEEPSGSYKKQSSRDGYKSLDFNPNSSRSDSYDYSQSNQYATTHLDDYNSRRSPPQNYHSAERYRFDPDVHRKYPDDSANQYSTERGRSPFRRYSPSQHLSNQGPSRFHSRSRSRSPNYRRRQLAPSHHSSGVASKYFSRSRSRSPVYNRNRSRSRSPRYGSSGKNAPNSDTFLTSIHLTTDDGHTHRSHSYVEKDEILSSNALDKLRASYEQKKIGSISSYLNQKKKQYATEKDTYLYSDDSSRNRSSKEIQNRLLSTTEDKSPPEQEDKSAVTPGGFDTNALKNVLKAIGFDFELSAQSFQKSANTSKKSPLSDQKPSLNIADFKMEKTQSPSKPSTTVVPSQDTRLVFQKPPEHTVPTLVSAASYIPSCVDGNFVYSQGGLPFPSNFPAPQIIYQPGLPQTTVLPFVQASTTGEFNVHERPNLKVVPTVSMEPLKKDKTATIKSTKSLEQEKKARMKRLDNLEFELKNLKKKQAELSRKKKKQLDSMDHKQLKENSLLQADVEKEIEKIREAAERAAGIRSSSESSDSDSSSSSNSDSEEKSFNFIDSGSHLCSNCNLSCSSLSEFFAHLHSKNHKKLMDPTYKPWYKKVAEKIKPNVPTKHLKGSQFLLPINGYYCDLCKIYSGDALAAEEHCKSQNHNRQYAAFCKKHPDYEKKKENSDLRLVANRLKKLKENQKEEKSFKEDKKPESSQFLFFDDLKPSKERSHGYNDRQDTKHVSSRYDDKRIDDRYDNKRVGDRFEDKRVDGRYDDRRVGDLYDDKRVEDKDRLYNDRKSERYDKKADKSEHNKYDEDRRSRNEFYAKQHYGGLKKRNNSYPDKYRDDVSVGSHSSSHSKDHKSYSDGKHYEKSHSKYDGQNRYQKPPAQSTHRKRSTSPYRINTSSKEFYSSKKSNHFPIKEKQRTEKNFQKPSKDFKKGVRKWSPGYDAFEKGQEESKSQNYPVEKKPSGNFGKFTWKKVDNRKMKNTADNEKNAETSNNNTEANNSTKILSKSTTISNRVFRNRSRLTNRITSFAPHTQVVQSNQDKTKESISIPKSVPSTDRQITKPASGPSSTDANYDDPPPPGTEDIFVEDADASLSDASGISMEIGSDVDN